MEISRKPQVAVLMATYNGESYLKEQINSILEQSFSDFMLIIRDDGSTDTTIEIINSFAEKDSRIMLLENTDSKHGAYHNFWCLLYYARTELSCDYYFLSDQDDVWETDKIELSIAKMRECGNDKPILLYSDMAVIDENNNYIYTSYDKIMNIKSAIPQATFFTRDIFWGCTMAFNMELLKRIPLVSLDDNRIAIISHDTYLAEYAALNGKVVYLGKVTIKHRKHSKNVTGDSTLKYSSRTVLNKIFGSTFKEKSRKHARTYAQSLIALSTFARNGILTEEAIRIEDSIKHGGISGVNMLIRYRVFKKNFSRTVLIYIIMLSKSYIKYIPYWMNITA